MTEKESKREYTITFTEEELCMIGESINSLMGTLKTMAISVPKVCLPIYVDHQELSDSIMNKISQAAQEREEA